MCLPRPHHQSPDDWHQLLIPVLRCARTSQVIYSRQAPTTMHDLLVYGATGFTGKLISQYLLRSAATRTPPLSVALAGRNLARLQELSRSLTSEEGLCAPSALLVADTQKDPADVIEGIVSSSKVVICAAGPFLEIAEPLVAAAAKCGVDYVDITGETPFVRRCITRYDSLARRNQCYIVNMAGFDSCPSDLGTYRTVARVRELFGQPTRRVECFVTMRGQLSGGTLASGLGMERDPTLFAQMQDPFLLGGRVGAPPREEDLDVKAAAPFDVGGDADDTAPSAWTAPFMMAELNTRVVRRSSALFREFAPPPSSSSSSSAAAAAAASSSYGDAFGYSERMLVADEAAAMKLARPSPPVEKREEMVKQGRLPKQGEGPSEAERAKGWFKFVFKGTAEDGRSVVTSVSGKDPGYDETSKMVSECALSLLLDRESMHAQTIGVSGGCLTPAFAFGDSIIQRLERAGIRFRDESAGFSTGSNAAAAAAAAVLGAASQGGSKRAGAHRSKL